MSVILRRVLAGGVVLGALFCGVAYAAPTETLTSSAKASFGIGFGGGGGDVGLGACNPGVDCSGAGPLSLVSAHITTFLGPITIGGRYVTELSRDGGHPSEVAGLVGIRPGERSPVSLMVGPGTIFHANHRSTREISVLSWEVLIAPHNRHVQFVVHGASSSEVNYVAFAFVTAFGKQ